MGDNAESDDVAALKHQSIMQQKEIAALKAKLGGKATTNGASEKPPPRVKAFQENENLHALAQNEPQIKKTTVKQVDANLPKAKRPLNLLSKLNGEDEDDEELDEMEANLR